MQLIIYAFAGVGRICIIIDMADGKSWRIQCNMAVFRMGQPDFVRIHVVDNNRIFGSAEETVYHHVDSGIVYDRGLRNIPLRFETGIWIQSEYRILYCRCHHCCCPGMVLRMDEKV